MGIGLVDPILKPIADELGASPSETSLLFTSYMAVMGVAMLVAGFISSCIGAKRTLLAGLSLIIVFSALAGMSDSIGAIVGGQLGSISWRAPFFGVAVLMAVAVLVTAFLLPPTPPSSRRTSLADPIRALKHPGLLTVALTALFYNMGFFTLLAFTPFPLDMSASQVGWIFFGWGLLLAITSVKTAPWLQRRFGTISSILGALTFFAADLAMMALFVESKTVLVIGVVIAGAFLGVNNTLITEAVMGSAPVERSVASSAYSFVRFSGGAVAPWAAGRLGEEISMSAPFWMGTVAVLIGVAIFAYGSRHLRPGAPMAHSPAEGEAVLVGDVD